MKFCQNYKEISFCLFHVFNYLIRSVLNVRLSLILATGKFKKKLYSTVKRCLSYTMNKDCIWNHIKKLILVIVVCRAATSLLAALYTRFWPCTVNDKWSDSFACWNTKKVLYLKSIFKLWGCNINGIIPLTSIMSYKKEYSDFKNNSILTAEVVNAKTQLNKPLLLRGL